MPKVVSGYKEAAKARIIGAAIEVFTQKGFGRSTMDEVAKKVGVSKPALYRYFPSKEALLEAVFEGSQARLRELLASSFQGRNLQTGVKVLFESLDATYGSRYDLILEWFATAARDDRLRKLIREDGERDIATVTGFITEQKRKGSLRTKARARTLAQIFETAWTGAWIRLAMGHDRDEVVQSLQDLVALAEAGR